MNESSAHVTLLLCPVVLLSILDVAESLEEVLGLVDVRRSDFQYAHPFDDGSRKLASGNEPKPIHRMEERLLEGQGCL